MSGSPGRLRRRCSGFTLVEILIAFTVLSVLVILVMELFVRGNKETAKGAWRVHTVAAMRRSLWRLKEMVRASSYPSVIRAADYLLLAPDAAPPNQSDVFLLVFNDSNCSTSAVSGGLRLYRFASPGYVVKFYMCEPMDESGYMGSSVSGVPPGTCTGVLLELVPGDNGMDLYVNTARADVTYDETTGGIVMGAFGNLARRLLLRDVDSVGFSIPASSSDLPPGTVMEMCLVCRDPFNRRMTIVERTRVEVNVRVAVTPESLTASFGVRP